MGNGKYFIISMSLPIPQINHLTMHKTINIAIADDSHILRYALMRKLEEQPGYNVVVEAVNGEDLIRKITEHRGTPDVCILDIGMPVMNGYDAIHTLQRKWPEMRILVFSVYYHQYAIKKMLLAGARGFIVKESALPILYDAVTAIKEAGYYYTTQVPKKMFDDAQNGLLKLADFTEMERLLLPRFCNTVHDNEIAGEYSLSARTVEKHKEHIYIKSGIDNREGLMKFALQNDLV